MKRTPLKRVKEQINLRIGYMIFTVVWPFYLAAYLICGKIKKKRWQIAIARDFMWRFLA
jgi:hypothetical protein